MGSEVQVMNTANLRRLAAIVCAALLALSQFVLAREATSSELRIRQVTPSGLDVPAGHQIIIEFDQPVVPLGRMERRSDELPISIEPMLNCKWRWLNPRALACNLDESDRLREATRYSLSIDPGILALSGSTTASRKTFSFTTTRPMVSHVFFNTWTHPGIPVLRVAFNQPVTKSSVERSLLLVAQEIQRSFPVTARPDPDDYELPRFIPIPGENLVIELDPQGAKESDDQAIQTEKGEQARRVWLVEPRTPLPLDSHVILRLNAGLRSAFGMEPGIEAAQVLEFHSFPEFRFLGVRCTNNEGDGVLLIPGLDDPQAPAHMCNPLESVGLSFSAPVLRSEVGKELIVDPGLTGGREDYDPWARRRDYARLDYLHHGRGRTYEVSLPESLLAFQQYKLASREPKPKHLFERLASWFGREKRSVDLRDEFGRLLAEPISTEFWTNHRRPDFTLTHRDAVLESGVDSEVPLYVTNLEQVHIDYRLLGERESVADRKHSVVVAGPEDLSFAIPLGLREMTDGQSGALYGSISSRPESFRNDFWDRRFFGQVTPYQVHAKVGHFNTLVWVTNLQTGEPVQGARVRIYRDSLNNLNAPPTDAESGRTDQQGMVLLAGTEALDADLDTFGWNCPGDSCGRLFVRVDGEQGMALLPLSNRFRVYASRVSDFSVYPSRQEKYGHMRAWGTTAQGVYRTGDRIQYKIYVRGQDNETLVSAPGGEYRLEVVDPTGKVVHSRDRIPLSEFGAFDGEWTVPSTNVMGWYSFHLFADFTERRWRPMHVLVSDFTPAAFRVRSGLNGDRFYPGDTPRIETQALLHSGGAYTQAEARVTAHLDQRSFRSSHPVARDFFFDSGPWRAEVMVHQEQGDLSDEGTHEASFRLDDENILYGRLRVESAVRDDRGKYVTASASADYIAVDRWVGLRKHQWVFDEDELAEIDAIVVDQLGVPVSDTPVEIHIEHLTTKVARVKGAGNAYLAQVVESWDVVSECGGTPNAAPLVCGFTPESPGRYRIIARVEDSKGKVHSTDLHAWVAGKGQVVWREDPSHALEMVPEADVYRIGDSARFLIKNPFPGATALVTIERYGVIKQWQTRLEGNTPILEFPIEERFFPGAYLSVVVFSPRVEAPPPDNSEGAGQVDLGKPAFRMGYAELPVVDESRRIQVDLSTDRIVYRPRERVRVEVNADVERGPVEFALLVLDDSVFDLLAAGIDYFDPYQGFHGLSALDLTNFSLLTRLIGRQKIEKKGANPGGDGGQGTPLRSIFKFVGYWNPSLLADADGNASVEFRLPDNLTSWRVLALAVTPTDGFGLGEYSFKTNQPTEIRPVMPNQVSEGDQFLAGFSVMNRTSVPREIEARIEASGDAVEGGGHVTQTMELDAYQRETLYLPLRAARLTAERDIRQGAIHFRARAGDAADSDGLVHELPVLKARELEVGAVYGSITSESARQEIVFPDEIYTDLGKVSVTLSPTVIGNLEGPFRYMRDYDYPCWEQILSSGVMASHFAELQHYLDESLEWPGSEGLAKETLALASNFQAPNGGMAYFTPRNAYASPYLSAYTALAFNWLRDAGHEIPAHTEQRLHDYLIGLLRRDNIPSFYSRGMASSVRAVALNALVKHGKLGRTDLDRYREYLPYMDLFGAANLLQAESQLRYSDQRTRPIINHIMARSNSTSGELAFSEVLDDGFKRLLSTGLRSNCAVLSAFSGFQGGDQFDQLAPRLARAITQARGNRDHWENTQENVFCMNALIDYAKRWEEANPEMKFEALLDDTRMGAGEFTAASNPAQEFSTPILASHPGSQSEIVINREGRGRLYYATRLAYAPKSDNPERVNAGIDLRREYAVLRDGEWRKLSGDAVIERGELVRVDLFVNIPTARNFVVVDDHVPGGLEPVNRDLATSSAVDAAQASFVAAGGSWWFNFSDWVYYGASRWSFYHREMRYDSVRFYSDHLPAGRYHLSYTAQAIASGRFHIRSARAAEMYDADIYGKTIPTSINVGASIHVVKLSSLWGCSLHVWGLKNKFEGFVVEGYAAAGTGGSGCQRRSSVSSRLARTAVLRMTATRATMGGLPASTSRPWKAAMSGLRRTAVRAAMNSALRTAGRPPTQVRRPERPPESRAMGAVPHRLAAPLVSSWPSSGASAMSTGAMASAMPGIEVSTSMRRRSAGSDETSSAMRFSSFLISRSRCRRCRPQAWRAGAEASEASRLEAATRSATSAERSCASSRSCRSALVRGRALGSSGPRARPMRASISASTRSVFASRPAARANSRARCGFGFSASIPASSSSDSSSAWCGPVGSYTTPSGDGPAQRSSARAPLASFENRSEAPSRSRCASRCALLTSTPTKLFDWVSFDMLSLLLSLSAVLSTKYPFRTSGKTVATILARGPFDQGMRGPSTAASGAAAAAPEVGPARRVHEVQLKQIRHASPVPPPQATRFTNSESLGTTGTQHQ